MTSLSFSGADVSAYAMRRGAGQVLAPLKSLQTISVSIFRDKRPVRSLGFRNVRGHGRAGRTIAGSMIFVLLDDHPLKDLMSKWMHGYDYSYDVGYHGAKPPDQIPPFTLILLYQNEAGKGGAMSLIDLEITNDGVVTSIQDMMTEQTFQYRARDIKIWDNLPELDEDQFTTYSARDKERLYHKTVANLGKEIRISDYPQVEPLSDHPTTRERAKRSHQRFRQEEKLTGYLNTIRNSGLA